MIRHLFTIDNVIIDRFHDQSGDCPGGPVRGSGWVGPSRWSGPPRDHVGVGTREFHVVVCTHPPLLGSRTGSSTVRLHRRRGEGLGHLMTRGEYD